MYPFDQPLFLFFDYDQFTEATAIVNFPGGVVSKGRRRGNDSDDDEDVNGTTGGGNCLG
jgi:hypothetical protein